MANQLRLAWWLLRGAWHIWASTAIVFGPEILRPLARRRVRCEVWEFVRVMAEVEYRT